MDDLSDQTLDAMKQNADIDRVTDDTDTENLYLNV